MIGGCRRYEQYKESGVEWIGEIPDNWDMIQLKYIGTAIIGLTYSPEDVVYDNEGTLVLRSSNILLGKIVLDDAVYVNKEIPRKLVTKKDDILICSRNGSRDLIGKCALIEESNNGLSFGAFTMVFRSQFNRFLYYVFSSPLFLFQSGSFLTSTINQLTVNNLKSFIIPLPSTEEQVHIVRFLDRQTTEIDSLIAEKERLIRLLEEQRQATITNAVTRGLDPSVYMKNSNLEWIGDIPEHWSVSRLSRFATVKARLGWKGLMASEYVDDGYVFLATPNIKTTEIDFQNVNYITAERYFESPEIMLEVNDVLLAKDGSTLGTVNVVRELPRSATVNSSIAVIRPQHESLEGVFLRYFLASNYMQNIIKRVKDGMGVPHLFQRDINKFDILVPPLEEQVQIADFLDEKTAEVNGLLADIKHQVSKLKEYRQALIFESVTGKIDVRDLAVETGKV